MISRRVLLLVIVLMLALPIGAVLLTDLSYATGLLIAVAAGVGVLLAGRAGR
ncbi:hypothetical protein ACN263_10345 [Micromonospora sp. WMMD729]|uniref:hypothetical protein n=1 Tax=Micromonospora sp. WMMD729 TaxID=3404127 RepID=UPI003BF4A2A9